MFNKDRQVEKNIVSLFVLVASFAFSPYLSLAQTDSSSPLNFEDDLEIFENKNEDVENTEENLETTKGNNEEEAITELAPSTEVLEEDELVGVEDDALNEDELPENNQEEEFLIGNESEILTDDDEVVEVEETDIEPTEVTTTGDEEEIVETEADVETVEEIESEEDEIAEINESIEVDTEAIEEINTQSEQDEGVAEINETEVIEEEDELAGVEDDILNEEDENVTTNQQVESLISNEVNEEEDELAGVEDDVLNEEDENVTTNQQVESLISNEVNEENDNALSQAVIQAEEVGLSASFIKLPFEETRAERLARLQQDEYFDELMHISQTGVHQYKVKASPLIGAIGLNIGVFPAPSIDAGSGVRYEEIYKNSTNMAFFLNYEWKIFKEIGSLSLLPEIGFSWATGGGIFEPGSDAAERGLTPKEKHFLLVVPVSVGVMYRLQYWKNQMFTPFAIGGGSYFGLLEVRDDNQSFGIAATPALYFGGGIQFLLDSLSRSAVNVLDREFGINHIYIVAEVRRYIGLSNNLNFSGFVISGGIRVDF